MRSGRVLDSGIGGGDDPGVPPPAHPKDTMRTVVVGAGPTGLFVGAALARRGHPVTVVDRDTGPATDGSWARRGVMQFHHPHAFRQQVGEALQAELPEAWDDLLAAGAEPVLIPGEAGRPDRVAGMRCRRLTFEKVLRAAAERQPGLTLRIGHVDDVRTERGRAVGVRVDGADLPADLVVDASGRAGRLGRELRAPATGGDCGIAYVSRQYQLHPGAEPGPMNSPIALVNFYPGYLTIVFPHDNGVFSTLIARPSTDRELAALRHTAAFDAAVAAIPPLAAWTDPQRAHPLTEVLPGGRLYNNYQGQADESGRIPLPGLVFVGDAVCTTNPAAGRGIALSLMQARELVRLLDAGAEDLAGCASTFDDWCTEHIRPWFADHVHTDTEQARRWAGADIEPAGSLPSDLIVAATEADPSMMRVVGPYLAMQALPTSLADVQERAREIYESGWRPPRPPGPSRDELAELVRRALSTR
jgi:2-polyprenyl-6-methoxyphenol hydroxylase-like FAD-dependent oxidoreductase